MSAVDGPTMTADDVLGAVDALAPTIADRAAEIEAAAPVPADLLDALIEAPAASGCSCRRATAALGADLPTRCACSRRSPRPTRRPAGP